MGWYPESWDGRHLWATPLSVACADGHLGIIGELLGHAPVGGLELMHGLMAAVANGRVEAANLLLALLSEGGDTAYPLWLTPAICLSGFDGGGDLLGIPYRHLPEYRRRRLVVILSRRARGLAASRFLAAEAHACRAAAEALVEEDRSTAESRSASLLFLMLAGPLLEHTLLLGRLACART